MSEPVLCPVCDEITNEAHSCAGCGDHICEYCDDCYCDERGYYVCECCLAQEAGYLQARHPEIVL